MRVLRRHRWCWFTGLLLWLAASAPLLAASAFDTAPARATLERWLPRQQAQITLVALPQHGPDHFRISGTRGHIVIAGTSPVVLLTGVETYLERVAHVSIGWPGTSLARLPATLPAPAAPIIRHAVVPDRYAFNDTDDGYSNAYLDWKGWQRKIDLLALHGFNEVFMPIGTGEVYRRTFRALGCSDVEIRAWIPAPAHQPWWLLGNLSGFDAPVSSHVYARRTALAKKIVDRLHALGMTPVFPGYLGMVPPCFATHHPDAHVVPQGTWYGFQRPGWLDPHTKVFTRVAAAFYRQQQQLFGNTTMYRMSLMHEGGRTGDVPIAAAARGVMVALQTAHPGSRWVMLGWESNPQHAVLAALDRQHLLILDGLSDRLDRLDREHGWDATPYAFGTIPNFGGHTVLGANAGVWLRRFPAWLHKPGSRLRGIAWLPEGSGDDPAAFALFSALAWAPLPHNAAHWFSAYAVSRYGASDPHAIAAWRILGNTAYAMPAGQWSEPQDSLFNARPGLDIVSAAMSGSTPHAMRYDPRRFDAAVCDLLAVAPALRTTSAYRYDLVDVTRQALSNRARVLLPEIRAAFTAKHATTLRALAQQWLGDMRLLNRLLASNRHFLLGNWLALARAAAATPAEAARLAYDQRSLITTWSGREPAGPGGLHDYANRELAGLVSGLYLPRWRRFFASLETSLATGQPPQRIDWFAIEQAWARSRTAEPTTPRGNSWQLAGLVAKRLGICR